MMDHTEPAARTLGSLIAAQAGQPLPTDDVLLLALPLFAQVAALHARGAVAALDADAVIVDADGGLALRRPDGQAPRMNIDAVHRIQPQPNSGMNIIGALQRSPDEHGGQAVSDLSLLHDASDKIERPVYLPGARSWEMELGHHDEITDVFLLGMLLASLACGLDFSDSADLREFVAHRRNLFQLYERLHPVVAAVIVEMTEINRHERATDVVGLATRLRTWREQAPLVDVERALAGASGPAPRRAAVLLHLRDRLFDLSRRNRLLYYRPTTATVNLTVASVPLVLQIERIRAEQICTWGGPFADAVLACKPVSLQRWLRFEDQPYLPASLDQLISETRRDRAEYGFSNLRLVLAFLRWHNLKEAPDERIVTPLLWLPVEVAKRKGVRDEYLVHCTSSEAEFNPVLRHHLQQLYDIRLPETVDLDKTSVTQIHADILAQIRRSEPGVELRLVDKAAIRMVRQKALQRMQQYQRRRSRVGRSHGAGWLPAYSYAPDDYRPLGRALFEHWVRPSELPLRFEAGAAAAARRPQMVETAVGQDERLGYVLEEADGHRYAWDFDLTQVSLANFNYRKMSLVRDYAQLLASTDANPAFDHVFSIEPKSIETAPAPLLAPAERWEVVASDATQQAAVALARTQRSFIIQGPPGTGKSQTITNLIADYVGRGKRVLFVCEKRAALDVVFHRLKRSGLEALCCLIHDSQADKKAFIADLKSCYEAWASLPHDCDGLVAKRAALADSIAANQRTLDEFEQAMAGTPAALGTSVRALLRQLAVLPPVPHAGPAVRERLPSLATWSAQRELAQRLHRTVRERFGFDSLSAHPFARLAAGLVADEHAYSRVQRLCDDVDALFSALDTVLDSDTTLISYDCPLDEAVRMASDCQALLDTGLAAHLDLLDPRSSASAELGRMRVRLAACAQALEQAQVATAYWREKLTPGDTETALEQARRMETSPARWLQPAWWRLRSELKRRYDFSRHAVHPGYGKVLAALAAEHAAAAALEAATAECSKCYGVDSLSGLVAHVDALIERRQAGGTLDALLDHLRSAADAVAAARAEARAHAHLLQLEKQLRETFPLGYASTLEQVAEAVRDLREALDELPDMLPLLRAVHAGDPACAYAMLTLPLLPDQADALVADEALRRLEREHPVLARFGGAAMAQITRTLARRQAELLSLNAEVVRAVRHRQFADNVRLSALSASQLDSAGKAFKKQYATGRRELEHEFGKSMRHRSIRDLSDGETGIVVNDLKPIWLMSPLSVSDTLPLSPDLFDVVIFDEASQIPTEEAIPALSRARQVVVVGDEMQLPPTNFFNAGAGEADNDIAVDEEGETIAICLDADSLLNQAARNLPATLLAWHYRSRHESLISFSNAAFYDGQLVTIPDQTLEEANSAAEPLRSNQEDAARQACDTLLARPLSFHLVTDGIYHERRNAAEARLIAGMVRELLQRESGLSIGVVAFSEAQQGAIETALDTLAEQDAGFAARLEREYVREDDDQFNGLFIKNLENVQGDERDVIILSICYAPGPDGKMLMNFGPINQRGGEKRLNVIFSRARCRMAVVSTILPEAITNVHNDGAAALRSFLQFAQASAAGQFERAQSVLGGLNHGARNAFARDLHMDSIRDAMAAALRSRGHAVHVGVGRSQFRCDLAIADPAGGRYALAILLDSPAATISHAGERYIFRPEILRSFGWSVLDIPGRDWIADPAAVLTRIETMLASGQDRALDVELDSLVAPVPMTDLPQQTLSQGDGEMPSAGSDDLTVQVRALRFEQGASSKFWRAAVRGTELTVSYGRTGTKGQVVLKQFDTEERARREMDKLVAEKLRKGYVES